VIDDTVWDAAVAQIREAQHLLLVGHVAPDGDALGSALAVGLALRAGWPDRQVEVSFGDDPFVVPGNLESLPGLDLLVAPTMVSAPDLVITFDASSTDRLGLLQPVAEAATVIAVDHHASYDGFGSLSLVDVTAPATAVLAERLILRLGLVVDHDVAANLYTGLVTDTGSFRYAGTTTETLQFAARLFDTGIRFDLIARNLFDTVPFVFLGLLGGALERATLEPADAGGLGLVWTIVPALERHQSDLPFDMVEPIIDSVRKAAEAEVAMVVKEDDAGRLRVSLRSKGRIDVSAVAVALGGGGHRYAAGFTADSDDLDALVDAVRQQLAAAPHLAP